MLGGIIENFNELNKFTQERKERYNLPLLFSSTDGFDLGDGTDEDNLPNDIWIERNHVKQRNECFFKYFFKED